MRSIAVLSRVSLVLTLVLLPVLGYLASRAEFGTPVVQDWLPKSSSALLQYDTFRSRFGEDQFLIASWRDCQWNDPRLSKLASSLRELAGGDSRFGILEVVDSESSVQSLADRRAGISTASALARLRGVAVGINGEGFLTIRLAAGNPEAYQPLIDAVRAAGREVDGLGGTSLILAGEPLQVATIDRSSRETIGRYVIPSSIVAVCVAWICLRSFRLTGIVFAFAGIGQLVGLSLIYLFLGQMSALIVVLPTLVFMLVLSAAIHLTSYYVESGGAENPSAGLQSLLLGFRPCALATLTTAFGFGSLAVSKLSPVWHFGSLAAAGLIIATLILLAAFAAAVDFRVPASWQNLAKRLPFLRAQKPASDDPWLRREQQAAGALASFCQAANRPLSALAIGLLAVALVGIPKLRTSTEFEHMFASDSPAVESLNWVRDHIGPINSLEVVVEIPQAESIDLLDRIECVRNVHASILELDSTISVASAATFLPKPASKSNLRSVIQRAVLRRRVEAALPTLADARVHFRDAAEQAGSEYWRITARIAGLTNESYSSIYQQIQQASRRGLAASALTSDVKPTAEIGGLRTVIESAHTSLLTDLGTSFLTAFLLITPVMMLIVRGFWSGIVLMIPNTIPVAIVFGSMGWLGIRLDVASILTASVALGIAVDDTLHFMNWYMRRLSDGARREDAVRSAVVACARPMLHTTVICTGAMAPFLFCDFIPTSKFALLMILTLSGAILGDLILLPALLLSPIGKLVGRQRDS